MMRISLDINGRDIGEIGVHNTGETLYGSHRYEVYDLSTEHEYLTDCPHPQIATVYHDRDHGAHMLASKVMATIDEEVLD